MLLPGLQLCNPFAAGSDHHCEPGLWILPMPYDLHMRPCHVVCQILRIDVTSEVAACSAAGHLRMSTTASLCQNEFLLAAWVHIFPCPFARRTAAAVPPRAPSPAHSKLLGMKLTRHAGSWPHLQAVLPKSIVSAVTSRIAACMTRSWPGKLLIQRTASHFLFQLHDA